MSPNFKPGAEEVPTAVVAWNLMGGALDWSALPVVAEMLGIEDIEAVVHQLVVIRAQQQEASDG